jgi:hypothetical protein
MISANGRTTLSLCSPADVAEAISLIVGRGNVTEVRALDATTPRDRYPHTESGYFNDPDKLAAAVAALTSAKGIYFIPNEVEPSLLSRAANRIRKTPKGESTADTQIIRRRWLLIDCDPQYPSGSSGIPSTDMEHQAALERAQAVDLFLHDNDWPDPIAADSGNGAHLLYRIDLPADDGGIVQRCLVVLSDRFTDAAVKIDTSVFNPSRIWKLYGTLACKGDHTPERPHRMARILNHPEQPQIVDVKLLEELAKQAPREDAIRNGQSLAAHHSNGTVDPFDVAGFISRHGFDVRGPDPWHGQQGSGQRWEFNTSPMCDHHGDGPYILQHASGAVSAGCHHNSCGWTWADLRRALEPQQRKERVFDGGDRWAEADALPAKSQPRVIEYKRITSAELAGGDYTIEFDIEETMVSGDPLVIAGPQKVLKTSLLIDAGVSLASCGFFLGKLRVNRARRVAVMTGESGLRVIQETALRICKAAEVALEDLENLVWSTDLPKFGEQVHLKALERFLAENRIESLVIDPAYLAMPGADAGNLMMQGELLRGVNDVCRHCGVTLILAHHTIKGAGRDNFEPLQLHDLAWAGFSEFAAQWWLINRRERYEPGTGEHRLWLTVGGRAGHSALWALDVAEGLRTDPGGRRWEVAMQPASEARDDAEKRKLDVKEQRRAEQVQADSKAVVEAIALQSGHTATKSIIRATSGINTSRLDAALASLLKNRDVAPVMITKGNNRTYEAFKLGDGSGQ